MNFLDKVGLGCNFLCAYLSEKLPDNWKDGEESFDIFICMTDSIDYPSPSVKITINKEAFNYIRQQVTK